MTNEESASGSGGGRSARQGSGNSPVGSTLSIVLAVVAVVAGFLILRNITDDGGSGSATDPTTDPAGETPSGTDPGDAGEAGEDTATGATTTTAPRKPNSSATICARVVSRP